jgi:predicted alpha/beta-hydrolase family hydrolase
MAEAKELRFMVEGAGEVCALLRQPAKAHSMLALAHGAGAGMRHAFLEQLADELAKAGVATLRYQFPYMEQHRKSPDKPAVLTAAVQSAARAATQAAPNLPLFAGGKSMGGRMTSQAAAAGLLTEVRGVVFYGFPLHPPKQPGTKRADHLAQLTAPMLFLQGTRDPFAPAQSIRAVCKKLGPRATLVIFEGADHSFHVPKSSGKTDSEIICELAQSTAKWMKK